MYMSMFSIKMAEVLCRDYRNHQSILKIAHLPGLSLGTRSTFASGFEPRILAPHSTEA